MYSKYKLYTKYKYFIGTVVVQQKRFIQLTQLTFKCLFLCDIYTYKKLFNKS